MYEILFKAIKSNKMYHQSQSPFIETAILILITFSRTDFLPRLFQELFFLYLNCSNLFDFSIECEQCCLYFTFTEEYFNI